MAAPTATARPLYERARNLTLPAELPAAVLGLALVTPIASANGGYDSTSWGWISLVLAWVAGLALVLRPNVTLSRLELLAVGALSLFALLTLLSAAWSGDAGGSVLSFERTLVYATALPVVLLTVRRSGLLWLVGGVWAAATLVCSYALATRLYPNRFPEPLQLAGNRLEAPIGYWNGLGLLAAIALVGALGIVVWSRSRLLAALAGCSVVPVALTLYFTFSRGAYLALAVGVVVLLALDRNRHRAAVALVAFALPTVLVVRHASHVAALTSRQVDPNTAAVAGAHMARTALAYTLVALALGLAMAEAGRRIELRERAERLGNRVLAVAALAAVLAGIVAVSAHYGSPIAAVSRAWSSFSEKPERKTSDLTQRLFTFSGTGRVKLWHVALDDFRSHPVLGSGAGTYERYWLRDRPNESQAVNAHNLYAETLAELGLPGLALLLVALLAPLVAAWRARAHPGVAVATAAYAAFVVHAFIDWDWQLPGVTLAAFLLGAGVLVAARDETTSRILPRRAVFAAAALLTAVALVSIPELVANRATHRAATLTARDDVPGAIAAARRAHRWAPWSSEPYRLLGEAQLADGQLPAARSSFRAALAKDRHDWRLWLDLALADSTPKPKLADARRALVLNPHSLEIRSIEEALGLGG
jgi:hypothetical protein